MDIINNIHIYIYTYYIIYKYVSYTYHTVSIYIIYRVYEWQVAICTAGCDKCLGYVGCHPLQLGYMYVLGYLPYSSPRTTVIFLGWFGFDTNQKWFDVVQRNVFRNIRDQWTQFASNQRFLTRLDELYSTLKLVGVSVFHCFWLIWAIQSHILTSGCLRAGRSRGNQSLGQIAPAFVKGCRIPKAGGRNWCSTNLALTCVHGIWWFIFMLFVLACIW